jgi:hypothetical protein
MLIAGVPAATGAAVAVSAPHPVRRAAIASVLVGLPFAALFVVIWDTPELFMRYSLIFGVEGAFLAALAISGLSAMTRPAGHRGPPSVERAGEDTRTESPR